ncbi:MAG: citrate/2-methylcitrate synthase [Anaerolineae bacterium]|nr:citrate/2-methylcitrate synthase [Anaerolineae bacterium]
MSNKGGLAGLIVADIQTSLVNGEEGKLVYSGYTIEDLAQNALFEEVVFLLHHVRLPNKAELEETRSKIAQNAAIPDAIIQMMKNTPKETPAMAVVRTATSMLSSYDADAENLTDKDVAREKALRMTGQVTTICAAWNRIRSEQDPIAPRTDLTLAQNFIYMLTGQEPDKTASDAINVYLVLLAEHGMNASTFTSRVITATGSDMHSAVVGAIGALKGPSHGGANAEAMKMFIEIGEPDNVEDWFKTNIKEGDRRIMGIGHRVYKAPDPRAAILKQHAQRLAASSGNSKWFEIADRLENAARHDDYFIERKLFPNVDYYSAIVLYTLDLEIDMFTPLFVMARMAGWTANIVDQMQGRLIRPKAQYVGPTGLSWTPPDER